MQQTEFSSQFRVYIEDTDAGGVVYYVNYLKFMERARTDFFRHIGFAKPALPSDDLLLMVASANIDYKRSATLDTLLSVSARPAKIARSYVVFEQVVSGLDKDQAPVVYALGSVKIACVNRVKMKPAALPSDMLQALKNSVIIDP